MVYVSLVVRSTRESIGRVRFTRAVLDFKVEGRQLFSPPGLPSIELFLSHEGLQAIVVCFDGYLCCSSLEIVSPLLESYHDG